MAGHTLNEIAKHLSGTLHGDTSLVITGIASLTNATPGTISFLDNIKYRKHLGHTQATAVLITSEFLNECPVNALVVEKPYLAFITLAATLFAPRSKPEIAGIHASAEIAEGCNIHPSASIGPFCHIGSNVTIAENVIIGANCNIDENCSIGANSKLWSNVTIYSDVKIGQRTTVHSGAVIGADGFGFIHHDAKWLKIPQLGGVTIGDDVEIGANTSIDRGSIENTTIGNGVKLDNLIQIAHNVKIGDHTVIAACVGIAGSTQIGRYCMIGGNAGIADHLEIADQVIITAKSNVSRSIKKPGVYSSVIRVQPIQEWRKNAARFRQLDEMARNLHSLEKRITMADQSQDTNHE